MPGPSTGDVAIGELLREELVLLALSMRRMLVIGELFPEKVGLDEFL